MTRGKTPTELVSLAIVLAAGLPTGGQESDTAAPQPPPSVSNLMPDRSWSPEAGEKGHVVAYNAPGAVSGAAFLEYQKFLAAKDRAGIDGLVKAKMISGVPVGTPLLVIKRWKPAPVSSGPMSLEGFRAGIQAGISEPVVVWPLEVRILEGEHKGQVRFIAEEEVGRLIPIPPPREPKKRRTFVPSAKPVPPEAKAATLLKSARALEIDGKFEGALGYYRQVLKDYPTTPAARTAAERVKALGGR